MSENLISENENAASETAMTENSTNEAEATTAVIKIEGQEFPLDVKIAAEDDLLKAALSPHYPSIKNASISRETRGTGQMIVSIVKKAEHKGISG